MSTFGFLHPEQFVNRKAYDSVERLVNSLEKMVLNLRTGDCWCGIDNPMMRGEHSDVCKEVREYFTTPGPKSRGNVRTALPPDLEGL